MERAVESSLKGTKDDPVTNGAAIGALIGAAVAGAMIAVAAKEGGRGLDQNALVLVIGAAGGAMVGAGVDVVLERSAPPRPIQRGARGGHSAPVTSSPCSRHPRRLEAVSWGGALSASADAHHLGSVRVP
jgi:hypothetical protein